MSLVVDALKKLKRENGTAARIQAPPSMKENYIETDGKRLSSFAAKGALAAGGILCAAVAAAGVFFFMQKNDPAPAVPYASAQKERGDLRASGVSASASSAPAGMASGGSSAGNAAAGNAAAPSGAAAVSDMPGSHVSGSGMTAAAQSAPGGSASSGSMSGGSVSNGSMSGGSAPGGLPSSGGSGMPAAAGSAGDENRDSSAPSSAMGAAFLPGFGAPAAPAQAAGGGQVEAMKANLDTWTLELPGFEGQGTSPASSAPSEAESGVSASSLFGIPAAPSAENKPSDLSGNSAPDENKTGSAVFFGEKNADNAASSGMPSARLTNDPGETPLKNTGRASKNASKAASGLSPLHGLSSSRDPLTVMGGKTVYPGDVLPEKRTGGTSSDSARGSGKPVSGNMPASSGISSEKADNAAAPRDFYGFPTPGSSAAAKGASAALGANSGGSGAPGYGSADSRPAVSGSSGSGSNGPFSMRNPSDPFGLSADGSGGPARGFGPAARPGGPYSEIPGDPAGRNAGDRNAPRAERPMPGGPGSANSAASFPGPDNDAGIPGSARPMPGSSAPVADSSMRVPEAPAEGSRRPSRPAGAGRASASALSSDQFPKDPLAGSPDLIKPAAPGTRPEKTGSSLRRESPVFPPLIDNKNAASAPGTIRGGGSMPAAARETAPATSRRPSARSSAPGKTESASKKRPQPFGAPSAVKTPLSNAEYASALAAGQAARDAGDYEAALENYQKAWRSRHEETVAADVAYLWLAAGSAENALAAVTQAGVKNPKAVAAIAVGMAEKSFLPEAGALLKYADRLNDTGAISYAKGYKAETEGNFKSAEEFYRAACRLDSKDPLYFYSLARALDLQGKYGEAIAEYRQVLALKPKNELSGYAVSRIRDLENYLSK